jgi:hypothetical protein
MFDQFTDYLALLTSWQSTRLRVDEMVVDESPPHRPFQPSVLIAGKEIQVHVLQIGWCWPYSKT